MHSDRVFFGSVLAIIFGFAFLLWSISASERAKVERCEKAGGVWAPAGRVLRCEGAVVSEEVKARRV